MAECTSCNAPLVADTPFCPGCGAPASRPAASAAACVTCDAELETDYEFCPLCGARQDAAGADEQLLSALEGAVDELSRILAELQAGRIEPAEAQRRAFRNGLVVHGDQAWILDPIQGCWSVYDGLRLLTMSESEAS